MKIKIDIEKRVRLAAYSFGFSFHEWTIEGKNVKEVINALMTDPTHLNNFVEAYPNCHFKIYEYEVGKLPYNSSRWDLIQLEKEKEEDIKAFDRASPGIYDTYMKSEKMMPVYFNQKVIVEFEQVDELIKKHRGYKNYMKLVDTVLKQRKRNDETQAKQQERIRKENDIFVLARMMKNNKDFKKMLKEASNLEKGLVPDMKLTMVSPDALGAYQNSVFNTLPKGEIPAEPTVEPTGDEKKY